jgi:hypothetical protein
MPFHNVRSAAASALLAVVASAALLALSVTASARQGAQPQAPRGKRGSIARKFHNIKVLGDLPAEQLLPIMQEWTTALGVKCEFCHVEDKTEEGKTVVNYEKETNPMKNVARDMYLLTTKLNTTEKSVGNSVTCYMCHKGDVSPTAKPAPKPAPHKKPPPGLRKQGGG